MDCISRTLQQSLILWCAIWVFISELGHHQHDSDQHNHAIWSDIETPQPSLCSFQIIRPPLPNLLMPSQHLLTSPHFYIDNSIIPLLTRHNHENNFLISSSNNIAGYITRKDALNFATNFSTIVPIKAYSQAFWMFLLIQVLDRQIAPSLLTSLWV